MSYIIDNQKSILFIELLNELKEELKNDISCDVSNIVTFFNFEKVKMEIKIICNHPIDTRQSFEYIINYDYANNLFEKDEEVQECIFKVLEKYKPIFRRRYIDCFYGRIQ